MVMVIETSSIDRGSNISEYIQASGGKGVPLFAVQFSSANAAGKRARSSRGWRAGGVSVRVNLNIKTQTVEELQEQKRLLHTVSARSILAEVKYMVSEVQSVGTTKFVQRCSQQGINWAQFVVSVGDFVDEIMGKCRQVVESLHNGCERFCK
jgi:hypothetical protein